jgi:hypothetical protein
MSSNPPAASPATKDPPAASTINSGKAIGGKLIISKTKLTVGGGTATGSELTLEDLLYITSAAGVEKFEIGGAEAEGASLSWGKEQKTNAPGSNVSDSLRAFTHLRKPERAL